MASNTISELELEQPDDPTVVEREAAERARTISRESLLVKLFLPLASLRLTVVLFALAVVLVFAGTLAQVDDDIWDVMRQYFRTFFAWIPFQVFFPRTFFAGEQWQVPGGIWFPGGWLIGGAMGINLLAAHALRFKIQSSGARLAAGLAVIAVGCVLVWIVVAGGSGKDTIEGAAPIAWHTLWTAFKLSLVAVLAAAVWGMTRLHRFRSLEGYLLGAGSIVLAALVLWLFAQGDGATLGDSSMRILWQLIKGGLAGLVLLAGCVLVFRKRAGIVLLHSGIALVMANELVVHTLHAEGQMQIKEGETVNFVYDIRAIELAVVDPSAAETDDVTVVPGAMLEAGKTIKDDSLPFDIRVEGFLQNSALERLKPDAKNPATAGAGLQWSAVPRRKGAGADAGGKVDASAAYVQLLKKGTNEPIGTFLTSIELLPQKVAVGDKTYDLSLRFKRTYKPYSMKLEDVRFDKYMGTQLAKNYSSDLRLTEPERNVDRDVHIWMNNPLRFAGETFYQSGFNVDGGTEITTLQVVNNTGWMIPYVACMLVGTGMLAQFSLTLVRFLRRRDESSPATAAVRVQRKSVVTPPASDRTSLIFAAVVVLACGAWVLSSARQPNPPISELQLAEFGRLPLVYEGRVKPFDTLARNMLRQIADKQTFEDTTGETPVKSQSAIKWLLDVITQSKNAFAHKVFRIENLEVLDTLGLTRRPGFQYSIDEFQSKIGDFEEQAALAAKAEKENPATVSLYQKKILELDKQIRLLTLLMGAFEQPQVRAEHVKEDLTAAIQKHQQLARMQPPLAIPPDEADAQWEPYTVAWTKAFAKANILQQEPSPATLLFNEMLSAYHAGNADKFNTALAGYETLLAEKKLIGYDQEKVNFEAFFNAFDPMYRALVLYFVAFALVALSWIGWSAPLGRAAFWLVIFTFLVHTFAVVARIYISGRPPVTNLYSSAVFIGWGAVLLGIVLEWIYRLGIGTVIAAVGGFASLLIAHGLAAGGDTFIVLQAVLDTQFWLATHVVCVTLGYTTTFIAALLAVLYVLRGAFTPTLTLQTGKDLSRMIYGSVCFALFFSFVGTVLGGLWADDSWGRFWGWDPKENGALMIVLWNALVLHARWGAIVKERGLAALAIGGGIVTSWSWFGVNELGVGLHSYGFTEGVLKALGLFIATQLLLIAVAMLPKRAWWSARAQGA